jgi:hypothetical protein
VLCLVVGVLVGVLFELVLELLGLEVAATGRAQDGGLTGETRFATGTGDVAAVMVRVFVHMNTSRGVHSWNL